MTEQTPDSFKRRVIRDALNDALAEAGSDVHFVPGVTYVDERGRHTARSEFVKNASRTILEALEEAEL